MKKISVVLLGLMLSTGVMAQETPTTPATTGTAEKKTSASEDNGYNPLSVRPIHASDIMWKKTILRALDLREKQNLPLFSVQKWITKLIIDAVENGDITPYANDSLTRKLTIDEFHQNMLMPSSGPQLSKEEIEIALANGDSSVLQSGQANYFNPQDLYQMELKEDIVFDKQRSRLYYDIQALTVKVPADHPANTKAIEYPVAAFAYKELVEKLFKDNPKAIWFNPQNDQQHKNLADAFELRLFSSYIVKVSNPKDQFLIDIYGGDPLKGIMASQWAAMEIMEYEHNLWEF